MWGPVTASKDWCEANYVYSAWVAEWWSTGSGAALCLAAVAGLWWTRGAERRFHLAFLGLFVVGLGTMAFHATLLRETQLLDQLPMWFLVTFLTWILADVDPRAPAGRGLTIGLAALAVGVPAAYVLARGTAQFLIFHLTFASLEVGCLARVGWLAARSSVPGARRRYLGALALYGGAVAAWFVDLLYCETSRAWLPWIEWHAVWHVGVAVAFLAMMLLLVRLREERLPGAAGPGAW